MSLHLKHISPSALQILGLLVLAFSLTPSAQAEGLGVAFETGSISVTSTDPQELSKKGKMNLAQIYSFVTFGRLDLHAGIGLHSSEIVGTDPARNVKQTYKLRSPALDLGAHFRVWNGFHLGLLTRNQVGKGASYGYEDLNKFVHVFSYGPSVYYRYTKGSVSFMAFAHDLRNQNDKRKTSTVSFGAGLTFELEDSNANNRR